MIIQCIIITESFESIFIELSNKGSKCKQPVIGVVCRPPKHNVDVFLSDFTHLLNKVNMVNPNSYNCFIMGDLNLDLQKLL